MCYICEREEAQREAAEVAAKAAEPKRSLSVSEVLRGEPCDYYASRLDRFEEDTIEVTVKLAVEQADDWDWYWAASRLLTEAGYRKFQEIADEDIKVRNSTTAPYQKLLNDAEGPALVEARAIKDRVIDETGDWNKAYAESDRVFTELTEVATAAVITVQQITNKRLTEAQAKAFAEIYISEEGTEDKTGNDQYYDNRDDDYEEED